MPQRGLSVERRAPQSCYNTMECHLKSVGRRLRQEFRPPESFSLPIKKALEALAALPTVSGDEKDKAGQTGQRVRPQARGSNVQSPTSATPREPKEK